MINDYDKVLEMDVGSFSDEDLSKYIHQLKVYKQVLNAYQQSIKIFINSIYGLTGAVCRWGDVDIASSITGVCSDIISNAGDYIDNFFIEQELKPIYVYSDTDSVYMSLTELVDMWFGNDNPSLREISQFIDEFSETTLQGIIDDYMQECMDRYRCGDTHRKYNYLTMNREVICQSMFLKAKKMYAMLVLDDEGKIYDPPKIKPKGLKLIRGNTPTFSKKHIENCLRFILNNDQDGLSRYVMKIKKDIKKEDLNDVANVFTVNNIYKYLLPNGDFVKGTRGDKKACVYYNNLLKEHGVSDKYHDIKEGSKVHVMYLKTPNNIGSDCIAWPYGEPLPEEFKLERYFDYNKLFDKVMGDIKQYTDILGWSYSDRGSVEDLFSNKVNKKIKKVKNRNHKIFNKMKENLK